MNEALEWIKALAKGKWWQHEESEDCARGYGDAETKTIAVDGTEIRGGTIARLEPFVLFAHVAYQRTGGDYITADGILPHFRITPFETDARDNSGNSPPPSFDVDGGLYSVPMPAKVQFLWQPPSNAVGKVTYTLTTMGPTRRAGPWAAGPTREPLSPLAPLATGRWHVTRMATPERPLRAPDFAGRFRVSDASYGVRVGLYAGAVVIPAPFGSPASLAGSPDVTVTVLAPLAGVAPALVPVEFYF